MNGGLFTQEDAELLGEIVAWLDRRMPATQLHARVLDLHRRAVAHFGLDPAENARGSFQTRCEAAHGSYGRCEGDRGHTGPHGASGDISFGRPTGEMVYWVDMTVAGVRQYGERERSTIMEFLSATRDQDR